MTIQEFGNRLKKAMKEKSLTQSKVAEELHISRQQVSNWLRGTCAPSFLVLMKIMEVTNKDANYFFGFPSYSKHSDNLRQGVALIRQALQKFEGEK